MRILSLPRDSLRQKVLDCYDRYTGLSPLHKASVGIYVRGQIYILNGKEDEQALRYDIGSVSKTLTAHIILLLVQEKKLSLNCPISDYLPLPRGNYPTVYELLTHTAGYHHLTPLEITLPSLIRRGYATHNPYTGVKKERVLKSLGRRNHKRKQHSYGYSDFAHAILALVAESVTGRSFASLLEAFLHCTLGLRETSLSLEERVPPAVKGGKAVPFWQWERDNPYIASGGVISSIKDLMRYVRFALENHEDYVLNARELCPGSFAKKSRIGTCLGWHTYKESGQLWHVGGVGTFRASVILNPQRQLGVAVLGNGKGKNSANVHYLAKMLYSELKMKRIRFARAERISL